MNRFLFATICILQSFACYSGINFNNAPKPENYSEKSHFVREYVRYCYDNRSFIFKDATMSNFERTYGPKAEKLWDSQKSPSKKQNAVYKVLPKDKEQARPEAGGNESGNFRSPSAIARATQGGKNCGDDNTEAAILKVLWWLKEQQNNDGSWGSYNKIANTSFAILAFLAHGEFPYSASPNEKDFGNVVQQGMDYLVKSLHVGVDGTPHFLGTDGNEYSFLLATYALCEGYGMTEDSKYKKAAEQCIERIVKNQSSTGGWDYKLNKNSTRDDLSFAGWALQALHAGKMAGIRVEDLQATINKALECLRRRNYSKSAGFTYTPNSGNDGGTPGLAGVGTLAFQLLGKGNEQEALNALEIMREWEPAFEPHKMLSGDDYSWRSRIGGCPQYYCYYATQCKWFAAKRIGASGKDIKTWQLWNETMKKFYTANIINVAKKAIGNDGTEHEQGYYENRDAHSTRPYMDSCLVALQLMTYYRHLSPGIRVQRYRPARVAGVNVNLDDFDLKTFLGFSFGEDIKVNVTNSKFFSGNGSIEEMAGSGLDPENVHKMYPGVRYSNKMAKPFRKFASAELLGTEKHKLHSVVLICPRSAFSTQALRVEEFRNVFGLLTKKYEIRFRIDLARNRAEFENKNVLVNVSLLDNGDIRLLVENKQVLAEEFMRKKGEQKLAEEERKREEEKERLRKDAGLDML